MSIDNAVVSEKENAVVVSLFLVFLLAEIPLHLEVGVAGLVHHQLETAKELMLQIEQFH